MIINKFNPNVDIFTEEGVLHLDKEGKGKGTAKVENIVSKLSGYTLVKENKPTVKENKTAVKEENKTTKRATTTKKRATSSKKEE
ncbi:hypothetical protein HWC08_gp165 [Lactobacillus phage 521B]|uniref:DUF7349 domain-containing protein n=2 Tax=Tybeckvirus TaxID=2843105 RepID=A0A4Y5FEM6_9CAUD|nr:hypothetical protein HWC08_gp165 [Lactobacillus phage 521B]YP_009844280.1 hypothetical protein HWC10_gp176 [Lactobacillus phage SAC12B]QBJ03476.1 hypothetical protein B521_0126 [Lactobacillus phage 521B]QBJ03914.1 hypothetical protein SAC12B_0125 [Lactobacillus phage SAC12B]